jgi:hypothetical protein
MSRKNLVLLLCGAALTVVTMVAMAANTVTLSGVTYSCPNRCVVNTYPNGGWMVRDSGGGVVDIVEAETVGD